MKSRKNNKLGFAIGINRHNLLQRQTLQVFASENLKVDTKAANVIVTF